MLRLVSTLGGVWLMACSLAQAADTIETIRAHRHTTADQPVELRTHAHWDSNCTALSLPVVTGLVEPAHGQVEQVTDTCRVTPTRSAPRTARDSSCVDCA